MPKYIALTQIITSRPGPDKKLARHAVPIGSVFDFTEEEVDALRGQTPPALRVAVNEMADGALIPNNAGGSVTSARVRRASEPVADATGL